MTVGENSRSLDQRDDPGPKPEAAAPVGVGSLAELENGILEQLRSAVARQREFESVLNTRERAITAREAEAASLRSKLTELAAAVSEEQVKALAARSAADSARETIEGERSALDAMRLALDSKEREIEALSAAADESSARGRAELERAERELQERARALAARESELTARERAVAADGEERLRAARAALDRAIADRDALAQRISSAEHDHARERAAFENEIAGVRRELRAAAADREDRVSAAATSGTELERERARYAALLGVVEEYEAWIGCERAESVGLLLRQRETDAELAEAGAVIEALKARLKTAMIAAPAPKAPVDPAAARSASWVAHRRARLAKVREAIGRRIARLQKGEEALAKRFDQCEQLLSQRAALATTHQKLRAVEQRQQSRRARGSAATVALCSVVMLAVLGVMSWAVAREFAPATFQAEAILGAEAKGRPLGEAELTEWQRYHESLLLDPMYHEAAADRFKRQGTETLVTPGQVRDLIFTAMTTESLRDGELRLRLRGEGADRTERVLDTMTAALASHANASASRRIDGGMTKVVHAAAAGDTPIDQTRNVWTLIVFGAATVCAFGFMGVVYLRLSKAKSKFESDAAIAESLDQERWADPRLTID
ncbi:MAG: hypothetical protein ACOYN0_05565 [Phycisphaerales bacterium]